VSRAPEVLESQGFREFLASPSLDIVT